MTKLPIFKLEDYLSTREFSAPYMFGSSDVESWKMSELVSMADKEGADLWRNLHLGYTETFGMPLLRHEIAKQYGESFSEESVLCFAGAEEGIYTACHALLEKDDHAIAITPCYQSLQSIPESMGMVTPIELSFEEGWTLNLDKVKEAIQKKTKIILVNFPHNPTGTMISCEEQKQLVDLARAHDLWIFSDEVYRYLELDREDRLPPMASVYEKGLSLGVMSKAFGLAGLRIGWIASQNTEVLKSFSDIKHYLSICNSGPSEVLALIALRAKDKILKRNLGIMKRNIALLDDFMNEKEELFDWVRPKGGCIAFPKLKANLSAYDFCEKLRKRKGVVTLPNTVYDFSGNHFRLGFGRQNMPEALKHFCDFVEEEF